jgi:cytochrome c551/c552
VNYKTSRPRILKHCFTLLAVITACIQTTHSQETPKEEDFFRIWKVSAPESVMLEVGGLTVMANGDLAVSTRRGDIFIVENPSSPRPFFRKFASGLHEVLGIAYKDGSFYCAQRGELTKITDTDMDGKADLFETVFAWPISGYYHEYSFGPKIAPDGSFFVSGNVAFGDEEWWRGESRVPWRGWIMRITQEGVMQPWATGVRSPCGLGMIDGELFYTDNQGDWVGTGGIWHVKKGAFFGHPAGLRWTNLPNSPLKLTTEQLYAKVAPRQEKNGQGRYIKPENVVNEKFVTLADIKKEIPELELPAVKLPYAIQGISTSEIVSIPDGVFGPFAGQALVGDQGQSKIMRVFMEKVNGEYQGAAWDFRAGFQSGVLRMAWGRDGSLFVGETNRGWGSAGDAPQGLQRLVWNNKMRFEMKTVKAMPDGFEIEFTRPVNKKTAEDLASYSVASFTYKYHPVYGSPPVNNETCPVKGVKVSEDGMKARIIVDNLRKTYIHTIMLEGIRDLDDSYSLVHPTVYYTLNNIPEGSKLSLAEVSTKFSGKKPLGTEISVKTTVPAKPGSKTAAKFALAKIPTYSEIQPLLLKNTCLSCHNATKKVVGPSYTEISKRHYSVEKIVSLIKNPQPQNWPGYATEMPPMPQVPQAEALKIATWIRSLSQ